MVAAPFLLDCLCHPFGRPQDVVTYTGTTTACLPWLGVFAGRDDGMRSARRDGLITVLRIVSAIATDAGNALVSRNLVEQGWHDKCTTDTAVGNFHGPDLERGRVEPEMHLASLAAVIRAALLRLPFVFARHLDARTVRQQIQARRARDSAYGYLQRLLPPADHTVARHRPVESGQVQQALRHPHGRTQRQAEQALDA